MAGGTITSSLIVRLVDQVTGPAKNIGKALLGIENVSKGGFGAALTQAIERNDAALAKARAGLVDAVAGYWALKTALGAPLKAAADFETALEDIGQKAGIPTERLGELGTKIRQIARETNTASMQIASAIDNLVGQGATEDVALAAAGPIGKAATAYRAATDDLAAASYAAVMNLKVPAGEIGSLLDKMAQAGKEGAFELRDMAQYFAGLAAQYQGLGQSGVGAAADLAAALQIVRKGTGDASTAATNLQNVLQKIYSNQTVKGFKKLGIDIRKEMEKAAAEGQTPIEAIARITDKALGGDLSKLGLIFEDAQVQAGMRTLIQNMEEYMRIRERATNASGVVDEDFARRVKTAQGATDRWKASVENLNISLGTALLPTLTGIVDKLVPIVDAIGGWIEKNPELASTIVTATAAVIGFKVAMAGLSYLGLLGRGGALQILAAGFNSVGKAAIAARGAVALQSSLAAMSGANYGGFAKFVDGLKGMALAVPGVSAIGGALSAIGAALATISAPVWGLIVAAVAAIAAAGITIWKYWDRISSIMAGVGQAIGDLAGQIPGVKPALGWLAAVGGEIGQAFGSVTEWIGKAWDAVKGFFASLFSQEKLTDGQKEEMRKAGYDLIMNMLNGMKQMFVDLLAWFSTWPQQILAAIGSIDLRGLFKMPDVGSWFGGGGGPGPNQSDTGGPVSMSDVQKFSAGRARGGNMWAGSTYKINEKGEEFFSPRSSVFAHKAGQAPGGNSLSIGQIVVQGASDPAATGRAVREAVRDEWNRLVRGAHSDAMARA